MTEHVCVECGASYPDMPNDLGDCPRCSHAGSLACALGAGTRHTLGPQGPEVEITRDLDARAVAALHRLAPWVVDLDSPLTAADREIAAVLGDDSPAGVQRVRRARLAAGLPSHRSGRAGGPSGSWVVSLPQWLASDLEAVDAATRTGRIRAHLAERGTRSGACAVGQWAVERLRGAVEAWAGGAQTRLVHNKPAPPSPADEGAAKIALGRLSADERDELARRAAWAGIRPAVYAAELALTE